MNIFRLDNDPVVAAQLQCDKHVVKMIVESAQMLSTVHRMLDGNLTNRLSANGRKTSYWMHSQDDILYRAVHHNHPSTVWTRESKANYEWHYAHFIGLCQEYEYRYNKTHATYQKLHTALAVTPDNIPDIGETPFKLAMGANPECQFPDDPVKSYRMFYKTKQDRFKMVWTNRPVPEWFSVK
jgi:hypothetical protein